MSTKEAICDLCERYGPPDADGWHPSPHTAHGWYRCKLQTPQGEPALTSPRELPGTREPVVTAPKGNAGESPASTSSKDVVLAPCPIDGMPVVWHHHQEPDCNGCHHLVCTSCGTWFDLSAKVDPDNNIETLTALQNAIAQQWNAINADETSHCIDCIELKNALASAVGIANEARECHDRDQDMRVMKILIALSGYLPKYRADTDRIHDVLKRAVDRLSTPMPPEEPFCDCPPECQGPDNTSKQCRAEKPAPKCSHGFGQRDCMIEECAHYPRSEKASRECCLDDPGGGFVCTLPAGHAGQHEAYGTHHNLLQSWSAVNGIRDERKT